MNLHVILSFHIIFVSVCVTAKGGGGHGGGHGSHGRSMAIRSYRVSQAMLHHPYSYTPLSHVSFTCRHCLHPTSYPVYYGFLPRYVYMYAERPGRYTQLLLGLALYNLGRSMGDDNHDYYRAPDEKCSLQVVDDTHFEETRFDCALMSSFLNQGHDNESLTNFTKVDVAGLLTKVGMPDIHGFRLQITNSQVCMLWHNRTMVKEMKDVPCSLLKKYSEMMTPSGIALYIWLPTLLGGVIVLSICCQFFKTRSNKLDAPLNNEQVIGYRSNAREP